MTNPCLFPEGRRASYRRSCTCLVAAGLLAFAGCDGPPTEPPDDFRTQAAPGGRGNPSGVDLVVDVLRGGTAVTTPNGLVLYLYSGPVGSNPDFILNDTDGDGTITGQVLAGTYVPVIKLVPTQFQGLSLVAPLPGTVDPSGINFANLLANAFAPVTQTLAGWTCASPGALATSFGEKPFEVPPSGLEVTVEVGSGVCPLTLHTVDFPAAVDGDLIYSVISRANTGIAGSPAGGTLPGILAFVSQVTNEQATVLCFGGPDFGVELLESEQVGQGANKFNKVASAQPGDCTSVGTLNLQTAVSKCEPTTTPPGTVSPFLLASYGYYFNRIVTATAVTKSPDRTIASTELLVDLAGVVYTVTTRTDYDNGGRLTTEREVLLNADGTCTYVGDIRRSGPRNDQSLDVSCQQLGDEYLITAVLSNYTANKLLAVGMGFKGPNGATFPSVLGGYFFMAEPGTDCDFTNDPVWSMEGWP